MRFLILFISFTTFSCNIKSISQTNKILSSNLDGELILGKLTVICNKKDPKRIFSEINIDADSRVGIYIRSNIEMFDSSYDPKFIDIKNDSNLIILTDDLMIDDFTSIKDLDLLIPTSVAYLKYRNSKYIAISLYLFSHMGGSYWNYLFVKVDSTDQITTGSIETNNDFNKDNILDILSSYFKEIENYEDYIQITDKT